MLAEYLDRYRKTLEMKCDGLDAEQLARRSVPPSTMSLLGLVRHMAAVEHRWFQRPCRAKDEPRLYRQGRGPRRRLQRGRRRPGGRRGGLGDLARAGRAAEEYYDGVDDLGATVDLDGDQVEIRDIVVHMIEEYARHCGHADLLRECIDGRTGQ